MPHAVLKTFSVASAVGDLALQANHEGLSFGGARTLFYSHVAIEMLRRQLFHQLGDDLARAILAQAGREAGYNDAQVLLQTQSFDNVEAMLEAQYALLARSGFGRLELIDLVANVSSRELYARVRCHASPEAESHRRLFGPSSVPACCHLVGYSTGWSAAVTGMRALTVETHCVAKGDDHCEFETLPYTEFVGPEAAFWKSAFENTSNSLAQQLSDKLATIEAQMETITSQSEELAKLSTPILQIRDDVLVLPVIGNVDPARVATMSETLLREIVRRHARGVIIDVTGVVTLDSATASQLVAMVRSIRLLGSTAVMSGISPSMSQVLVAEGIDLTELPTQRTLQDALAHYENRLRATASSSRHA